MKRTTKKTTRKPARKAAAKSAKSCGRGKSAVKAYKVGSYCRRKAK